MIQITNFTIKKAYEPQGGFKENQPQRELSANTGTKDNPKWEKIGAGWIKTDTKGGQYVSVALSDKSNSYSKKDGTQVNESAWTLVKTEELQKLLNGNKAIEVPDMETGEVIDEAQTPF